MVDGGWWIAKSAVLGFPQVEHLFKTVNRVDALARFDCYLQLDPPFTIHHPPSTIHPIPNH